MTFNKEYTALPKKSFMQYFMPDNIKKVLTRLANELFFFFILFENIDVENAFTYMEINARRYNPANCT